MKNLTRKNKVKRIAVAFLVVLMTLSTITFNASERFTGTITSFENMENIEYFNIEEFFYSEELFSKDEISVIWSEDFILSEVVLNDFEEFEIVERTEVMSFQDFLEENFEAPIDFEWVVGEERAKKLDDPLIVQERISQAHNNSIRHLIEVMPFSMPFPDLSPWMNVGTQWTLIGNFSNPTIGGINDLFFGSSVQSPNRSVELRITGGRQVLAQRSVLPGDGIVARNLPRGAGGSIRMEARVVSSPAQFRFTMLQAW